MKLVKLVYIAHGWSLGYFERPLIQEPVQAWQHGPVIRSVYNAFREFGSSPIDLSMSGRSRAEELSPDVQGLLDTVWNNYKALNGVQLSALTHQPNTPWDITWNQLGGKDRRGAVISDMTISAHYKSKLKSNAAQEVL